MTILEDPLHASAQLPFGTAADVDRLRQALERLRLAVQHSHVLAAEAREYGDAWLRNRVKVHVNITNRVDASFCRCGRHTRHPPYSPTLARGPARDFFPGAVEL